MVELVKNIIAVKDICNSRDVEELLPVLRTHLDKDIGFYAYEYEFAERLSNRCGLPSTVKLFVG